MNKMEYFKWFKREREANYKTIAAMITLTLLIIFLIFGVCYKVTENSIEMTMKSIDLSPIKWEIEKFPERIDAYPSGIWN